MGIEDDLIEQERWSRRSDLYKRAHPAPCPDLAGRGEMTSYGKEQYIHALEKKLKEKDAVIKWLADYLCRVYQNEWVPDCCVGKLLTADDWGQIAEQTRQREEP